MAEPAGGTPSRSPAPGAFQLLQLGAVWGALIGLGTIGGYLLDRALESGPLLTFVGLALGIFCAIAGSYVLLRPYLTDLPQRSPSKDDV